LETLLADGDDPADIVVVDTDRSRLDAASAQGLVTVTGDATRSSVLRIAGVDRAAAIVIATNSDDTAVLVTPTARQLAPNVRIVAAVRESENRRLLRQSGADSVVVSAETAGRLLGMATTTPNVLDVVDDLITPHTGLVIGGAVRRGLRGGGLAAAPVRHRAGGDPRRHPCTGLMPRPWTRSSPATGWSMCARPASTGIPAPSGTVGGDPIELSIVTCDRRRPPRRRSCRRR
jgi:voltage-gated potassium channel Kch